jgi:hypothetical protein
MTAEQMKAFVLEDLFKRARNGDNEASRVLLEHFERKEQMDYANNFAAQEASKLMEKIAGKRPKNNNGETLDEYTKRRKELGIDA